MLISLAVFGSEVTTAVSWSYGVAVISNVLCLCAAIAAAVQLVRSK